MAYQQATGRVEQPVWVGDTEDLKALVREIEELARHVQEKRTVNAEANKERRRTEFMKGKLPSISEEAWASAFEDREKGFYELLPSSTDLRMTIKYRRWDLTDSGTPAELLENHIDVKDVRSISIGLAGSSYAHADGYDLSVSLGPDGASASIKAPESHFIDLAAARMKGRFQRQRPWYWFFRAKWIVWLAGIPSLIASPFVVNSAISNGYSLAVAVIAIGLFTVGSMTIGILLMRLLARPFELLKEGRKGRSATSLARIGAAAVWALGSVFVPAWQAPASDAEPTPQPSVTVTVTPSG